MLKILIKIFPGTILFIDITLFLIMHITTNKNIMIFLYPIIIEISIDMIIITILTTINLTTVTLKRKKEELKKQLKEKLIDRFVYCIYFILIINMSTLFYNNYYFV